MAGTITKRGKDTWRIRISFGTDSKGKRLTFSKTIHGSKKDADKFLTAKLREKDLGTFVQPSSIDLSTYLDQWLNESASNRVTKSTLINYKDILRIYVRPILGARRLADIKLVDIQKLCNDVSASGKSASTVHNVHSVLSGAFKQAIIWHMLAVNPCTGVKLPKKEHAEMNAFNVNEARAFLRACEKIDNCGTCSKCKEMNDCLSGKPCDACRIRNGRGSKRLYCEKKCENVVDRYGCLFAFALESGMRPEEYLGLKWSDLDFERKTVSVQRALIRSKAKGGGWYFDKPKTPKSRRSIPIRSEVILEMLKVHRRKQREHMMLLGTEYERHDLVFANDFGRPLDLKNLRTRSFQRILKAAGLSGRSFRVYDLRHSMATVMLAEGENPKVVSERLGHASIALTMDTYSHALPGIQDDAADRLARTLYGR